MESNEKPNVKESILNQDIEESDNKNKQVGSIPDKKKMTIIDLMFGKRQGATFLSNYEAIKALPLLNEMEKAFVDEVYTDIRTMNIGEDVNQIVNGNQIKAELYAMCKIPREVVERVERENKERGERFKARIAEERKEWDEREARAKAMASENAKEGADEERSNEDESEEREEDREPVEYKEDLYKPGFLCGRSREVPEQPFVEYMRYSPERIESASPKEIYQFADRNYKIKKVGQVQYMSTPNLKDVIFEYEITITKDDISKTVRRYGEISFDKLNDPFYSTVVFTQLLGLNNLTDKQLHGYIGCLENIQGEDGKAKKQYRMVHLPEQYTAVVTLEKIEQIKEERRKAQAIGSKEEDKGEEK